MVARTCVGSSPPSARKALVPREHVAAVQHVQVAAAAAAAAVWRRVKATAWSVLSATVPGSCARVFFRPARVSGGRRGARVNRRADVQDQEKDDAHASEEEEEEELKEEEEEERRTGDDEGNPSPHPNNHDLHRNEKAVPVNSEEMTRRCFW